MDITSVVCKEVRDRQEIADALYRFAAGIDFNSKELLESALFLDAVTDFRPAAKKAGVDFPLLTGRENIIVQALMNSVGLLDTTHTATNPRIHIDGDTAKLYAIVEAQHLPTLDRSRHFLMKNRYDLDMIRNGQRWVIKYLYVDNVWYTGDPKVLIGQ